MLFGAALGLLAIALAVVYLVLRLNPLQFGRHRFDYVLFHIALASACAITGLRLLDGTPLSPVHIAVVVLALTHLSITHVPGKAWEPPSYMTTDHDSDAKSLGDGGRDDA